MVGQRMIAEGTKIEVWHGPRRARLNAEYEEGKDHDV
jgi:hypothetical protein